MCGIAGYATTGPGLAPGVLAALGGALAHRGPDAAGAVRFRADGARAADAEPAVAGLAHRRLSIIDLSPAGTQPMANEDERLWLTYNGEFYNFAEHRAELPARGHVLRSQTDTETILHLFEDHGLAGTLARMNGQYAFGLWDCRDRTLWLARDRLGKKPVYYVHQPDGTLYFASEIKALAAAGCFDRSALNLAALDEVWTVGCTVGTHTIYRDVHRLPPAHWLRWRDGKIETGRYWDTAFAAEPEPGRPLDELADELEALLSDAIRLRFVADVPVGVFLSAGVDSSLITALARRVMGAGLRAFTIGFRESDFDESAPAAAIARHLGVDHRVLTLNGDGTEEAEAVARQFDEPFGDSSALPTWAVSKLARAQVTVALTGDGGDELFAGYESFRQGLRIWGNARERAAFQRPLTWSERLWEWRVRQRGFEGGFMRLDGKLARRRRAQLFSPDFLTRVPPDAAACQRPPLLARTRGVDLRSRLQDVTFRTWLPDDFLRKVDIASMAHALECRSPLLDYRVVEFAARLPWSACYDEFGRGKRILRRLLERHVPAELVNQPKRGFGVPWERWCAGERGEQLRARWRRVAAPWFRPDAADWLYPAAGGASNFLAWNAFVTTVFLERQAEGRS